MGFDVHVILTPTAARWLSMDAVMAASGNRVHHVFPLPEQQTVLPEASVVLAAPLTFNTLNKWAGGVSDTLALGVLNEAVGRGVRTVAAPFVNSALRRHPAFNTSIGVLHRAGVRFVNTPAEAVANDWEPVLRMLR